MKHLKALFLILIFSATVSCHLQQLVQTSNDAKKIKENEKLFIGKPLKNLLKEIKPEIKMAYGDPSINIQSKVGYFRFKFVDFKQNNSLKANGKMPVSIIVYVKENFDWDFQKRPKGKELQWTKEDEKKYGDLTIVAFRVYGEDPH